MEQVRDVPRRHAFLRAGPSRTRLLLTSFCLLCCLVAGAGYLILDRDWLDDVWDLTIRITVLLALVGAALAAWRAVGTAASALARRAIAAGCLGLLLLCGAFAYTSYADASVELAAIVAGRQPGAETSIVLGPDRTDVRLSGDLTEGVTGRLRALLDANPQVTRIHLTSDGGLVEEGQALEELIADRDLTTFVPDYCASACTLAFVGGGERLVMKGARLGFHAPYEEGIFGELFQGDGETERQAYIDAGVTPAFVDAAMKTASDDMWFPPADALIGAGVATGVVDRYRFPDSNLDGGATLAGARAVIARSFPLVTALEARRPGTLGSAAAWYLDAYKRGLSEGLIADGLRARIGRGVVAALAQADDETLYGLARYLSRAMKTIAPGAPNRCVEIGENADLVAAAYLLDRTQDEEEKTGDEAAGLLTKALRSAKAGEAEPEVVTGRSVNVAKPSTTACQDVIGAYDEVLRMSPSDAASEIRSLLAAHIQVAAHTTPAVTAGAKARAQ